MRRAKELGFQVRSDFGIGVYNSQTLKELKKLGVEGATASFELKFAQIRDLSKAIPPGGRCLWPAAFDDYGKLHHPQPHRPALL